MAVALLAGAHKFHFALLAFIIEFHLRRTKVLEHTQVCLASEGALQLLRHRYTHANTTLPLVLRVSLALWRGVKGEV